MAGQYASLCYDEQGSILLDLGIDKPLLIEEIDDPLENLDLEYEALGIMLSNNPLHFKKDLLLANNVKPIVEADTSNTFRVAGIVKTKKTITTKKGTPMAFIKLFDETGEMEIVIFPDLYANHITTTEKNNILVISGKVERKQDETTFLADEISLLEEN
jgi:DNA polymerase-3 subunit alpha